MAFNIVAQPNQYHPGYNPVVYGANDTDYTFPGYRYIFSFYENGETTPFQILKAAPNPVNGDGIVDVSKALQSFISYDLDFNQLEPVIAESSYFTYDVKIGLEYIVNWSFTGFTNDAPYVKLESTITSLYSFGDYINIMIDPAITDDRTALNGTFRIIDIGTNYIVINLLYTALGGGASIGGTTYALNGELISINDIETITYRYVYNEAIPFKDFPTWTENNILPTQDEDPQGDILTNSPNYLSTFNDNDKYIIKTYQELYWNAMNHSLFVTGGQTLANTMIVENEFGDRWMLVDYDNWDNGDIKMRQFNVSPNNPEWINITPNFGNTLGYQYGFNPYTHIGVDGTLSVSKYLDYYTTFAPGVDECDEIILFIELDPTPPGPPTENYIFTARPVGRGFNGRRIYSTIIDDKPAVIWSDILSPTVRNWKITFTNANPYQAASQYKSFATRTSNALPFGQSYAISNSVDAWKAFDGNPTTFYQTTDNSGVATITYNFSTGAIRWADIQSYTINKGGALVNAPTAWRVEASQNGSTWTVVHTVTGNNTNATYNSPQLGGTVKWAYVRLVVTATFPPIFGPTNVRIFEFSINSNATVATMTSGNDCPINTPFTPWTWVGPNPPVGMDASIIETFGNGPITFPTLKKRRVYLDYTCQDNETQLLFLDRSGSWSSFAFPLKVNERMDNEKLGYRTNIGFVDNGAWTYNTYDSEAKTYHSNVKKQYNLTTNFLNESMDEYFQELISSPQVYVKLKDSNDWLSCNVLTKSLEPITRRLKQRTITIELNSQDNINI